MNENETIIVAAFADEAGAEAAIEKLREWDKRVDEVKLGVIGTVRNEGGAVKSRIAHGGLFNRSMPITKEAVNVLGMELSDNQVAVVVACDDFEASMVSDGLKRDGGRILAGTYERTKEEIAAENKAVEKALEEKAVQEASRQAPRNADRNMSRPQ